MDPKDVLSRSVHNFFPKKMIIVDPKDVDEFIDGTEEE